jgi:hypothetical protein
VTPFAADSCYKPSKEGSIGVLTERGRTDRFFICVPYAQEIRGSISSFPHAQPNVVVTDARIRKTMNDEAKPYRSPESAADERHRAGEMCLGHSESLIHLPPVPKCLLQNKLPYIHTYIHDKCLNFPFPPEVSVHKAAYKREPWMTL